MSQKLPVMANNWKIVQLIGWKKIKWITLRGLFQNAYKNLTLSSAIQMFVFYSVSIENQTYFSKLTIGTVWREFHRKIDGSNGWKTLGRH